MHRTIFIAACILAFAAPAYAADKIDTAGFLPGNIWYSKDPFYAGDKIEVHTFIFNSTQKSFSGTVDFYDADKLIGERSVSVAASGGSLDVLIPWTVTEGYHKIYAVIKNDALANNRTDDSDKFAAAPVATGNGSATSSASIYVTQQLDLAKQYAEKNLPSPILTSASAAGGAVEKARLAAKSWTDGEGAVLNKKIAALPKTPVKNKGDAVSFLGGAERPLYYLGVFLSTLASSLLGSQTIFYGALFVILFFAVRFVKRVFFF